MLGGISPGHGFSLVLIKGSWAWGSIFTVSLWWWQTPQMNLRNLIHVWETCWKSTTISALLLFFTPHAQNREDIIFHHLIYSCFPALSLRATVSISPVWNKHKRNLTQLESPYRPEAFDPFTRKPGAWKAYTCRSGGGSAVKEGFVLDRERERDTRSGRTGGRTGHQHTGRVKELQRWRSDQTGLRRSRAKLWGKFTGTLIFQMFSTHPGFVRVFTPFFLQHISVLLVAVLLVHPSSRSPPSSNF